MTALFSRISLIPIEIITFFWEKNYYGLISAWVAETEQMSGLKGDAFDMFFCVLFEFQKSRQNGAVFGLPLSSKGHGCSHVARRNVTYF